MVKNCLVRKENNLFPMFIQLCKKPHKKIFRSLMIHFIMRFILERSTGGPIVLSKVSVLVCKSLEVTLQKLVEIVREQTIH